MRRFHFNMRDGRSLEVDQHGVLLPSIEDARSEALLAAREMAAELILAGKLIDGQRFEICDDAGEVLETVPLKAAIRLN